MMQVHFYVLFVFTLQSKGGVATTNLNVDFEDLPYPRGSYAPGFVSKWQQKMPRQLLKSTLCKNRAIESVREKPWGVVTTPPSVVRGLTYRLPLNWVHK